MRGLWHACRKAKEKILSDPHSGVQPVTILGRGSGLIGGTIKTDLDGAVVQQVILDGFFPKCDRSAMPVVSQKAGIREAGLSYESDPAVTRHLAKFISRQSSPNDGLKLPSAVLFNGGVMKAESVRQRILDILTEWMENENSKAVREIASTDLDLAVAKGAVYYGLARRGEGVRIRGGLGRSYYIGIAASLPAVPGMSAPLKALCVAPFGMEEGTKVALPSQEFVLVVGEPVKFDFLGSSIRRDDAAGTMVEDWEGEVDEITTMETTLDGEPGSIVPVTLEINVTEVGTLELWCVSKPDHQRWKLEFNVREQETAI
jgi:hypothetical protein